MSNVSNQHGLHANRVALPPLARLALIATRRIQGIPVKVLAKRLGVAPRTLISWQMGERRPTQLQLSRWWLEVMQQELSGEVAHAERGRAS